MPVLITLAQAKAQLQMLPSEDDRDSEIILKMEEASDIVVGYLKNSEHGWTDRTVPGRVRAAILLVFSNLWAHRGDDEYADPISDAVKSLLMRDRDPAIA